MIPLLTSTIQRDKYCHYCLHHGSHLDYISCYLSPREVIDGGYEKDDKNYYQEGSHVGMLWCRNGVELGSQSLEVCVFRKLALFFQELPLAFSLQVDLSWAKRIGFWNEVILVNSFWINAFLPYWREKSGFSSSFSMFLTFLAKYSGLGLLKKFSYVVLPNQLDLLLSWSGK